MLFVLYIVAAAFLSPIDVVQSKCIETPQIPDGITVHKIISTWDEADLHCKSEDAVLASPINTKLLNIMKSLIGMNDAQYFIGTRATHFPGPFVSVEGVPLDNMTTAVMEMVQQLDPRNGDCLSMDEHSIRVVPCCIRLPFMCYKANMENVNVQRIIETTDENSTTEQRTEQDLTTESTEQSNEDLHKIKNNTTVPVTGYRYYESTGSSYKAYSQNKTWDDASAKCEADNAHLVVIDDAFEAQLLKHIFSDILSFPYAYIGMRDFERNGIWKSVTGKHVDELYHVWAYGEPSCNIGNCACGALIVNGKIDDRNCTVTRPFICEIEEGSI